MAERKISLSNLLQRVRLSEQRFAIGPRRDEPEVRYVPEDQYNNLLHRSQVEKEEAYRNGHTDGQQMGYAKGHEESLEICSKFNRLIQNVQNQRAEIYRAAELEVVELAYAIARKVIGSYAETKPDIVMNSAQKAVKLLLDRSKLSVKVSPEQEEFVKANLDRLYAMDDSIQRIEVEADRRVGVGGCILETESGNVDARIDTELECIADTIKKINLNQAED